MPYQAISSGKAKYPKGLSSNYWLYFIQNE